MHNFVHDNNNPDAPGAGIASAAPTGTGLLLYGGRDNMISDNVFSGNGAWGIVFVTYPDPETPPDDAVASSENCFARLPKSSPFFARSRTCRAFSLIFSTSSGTG